VIYTTSGYNDKPGQHNCLESAAAEITITRIPMGNIISWSDLQGGHGFEWMVIMGEDRRILISTAHRLTGSLLYNFSR